MPVEVRLNITARGLTASSLELVSIATIYHLHAYLALCEQR